MKKIDSNLLSLMDYLKKYVKDNGYPPSVREMAKSINVSSTSTVHYYLDKLEESGKIKRGVAKNRAIEILDKDNEKISHINNDFQNIPLVGDVAAGVPILAINNLEEDYDLPKKLFGTGSLFMLTVHGDSMIDIGILEGDMIVVRKQEMANNGEIVVAMNNECVTVKRFYKEDGRFRLQPENVYMKPIYLKEVEIVGKVVGLIRAYKKM